MGIGVASTDAFGVAAGAGLPDPRVETDYPPRGWIWKGSFTAADSVLATALTQVYHFPTIEFDIRSLRKVDKGVLYFTAVKTVLSGSAFDLQLDGLIRVLCLV